MISHLIFTLAADPAPASGGGAAGMFIPFICIGIIFYFLIIRPQRLQQKKLATLISELKTGDKVITNSGIHGTISNVKDGPTLVLKVDENCKLTVDKAAIATVLKE